jgi:hypothetical protein
VCILEEQVLCACNWSRLLLSSIRTTRRLGHPSKDRLIEVLKYTTGIDLEAKTISNIVYRACELAKAEKVWSRDRRARESESGRVYHFDCSEIRQLSHSNYRYFHLGVDDYNRYIFITFSKKKNYVSTFIKDVLNSLFIRFSYWPRWISVDGGPEFSPVRMAIFCHDKGI